MLGWNGRIVRCGDRRHPQKLIEPRWRKHKEIVIFDDAGITQPVRNVARSDEAITCPEDEDLSADGGFQFSGEDWRSPGSQAKAAPLVPPQPHGRKKLASTR